MGEAVQMADRLQVLSELGLSDAGDHGAKAANLGELIHAGFRVPPGFVVPAAMRGTNRTDLEKVLRTALADLGAQSVAVRSSALGEDSAVSSYAGVYDTFTDIGVAGAGVAAVVEAVQGCWASLDSPRSDAYRSATGLGQIRDMAVVVQQMIHAEASGVAFSIDPVTAERDTLLIESVRGAGGRLVSGTVRPERFRVARSGVPEAGEMSGAGGLMVAEVARAVIAVEEHLGNPVDVEWCWVDGLLHLVQARPATGVTLGPSRRDPGEKTYATDVVLRGEPACPGCATGPASVVAEISGIDQVADGDVLVTRFTSPEWMPALVRCAALVTEVGGVTSHAAIVSRELGLPCVVGAASAMKVLSSGERVTVDGGAGTIQTESGRRG